MLYCLKIYKNVKKKEYDREKQRYEDLKKYYEVREHNKKKLEICGLMAIKAYSCIWCRRKRCFEKASRRYKKCRCTQ